MDPKQPGIQAKGDVKTSLHDGAIPELEDSNEGSTRPTTAESAAAGDGASSAGEAGAAIFGSNSGDSRSGSVSTGGFETMLGRLVVQAGLVTTDEIQQCNNLLDEMSDDEPSTLTDILLENEFVTKRQLDRIRGEFEAKKSSKSIPGFRIKRKLGAGAMATVFLAEQLSLHRDVAVKILPKKFSSNQSFIERFVKEGRAAAQLNHPNIVGAFDVGRAGDHHYFVMEYVDGPTIYDRLVSEKVIPEHDAIDIVRQVALALEHAHQRDFIHRDIKPKNIMLTQSGVVKLADLGLARAMSDKDAAKAESGRAYGTPYYISPEQIRGQLEIGPQADIYGLGATFYHMVTGRVPFEGKNPSEVMHKHLKSELKPPDHINPKISGGTAQVIEMMMAKSVGERYQTAHDVLTDLNLIARDEPPHFARRAIDLHGLHDTATAHITGAAKPEPTQIVEHTPAVAEQRSSSALLMTVIVLLVLSVLTNLILVAMLASA